MKDETGIKQDNFIKATTAKEFIEDNQALLGSAEKLSPPNQILYIAFIAIFPLLYIFGIVLVFLLGNISGVFDYLALNMLIGNLFFSIAVAMIVYMPVVIIKAQASFLMYLWKQEAKSLKNQ